MSYYEYEPEYEPDIQERARRKRVLVLLAFGIVLVVVLGTFGLIGFLIYVTSQEITLIGLAQETVSWAVTPTVLIGLFLLGVFMCFRVESPESRLSALSGIGTGLIALSLYIVWVTGSYLDLPSVIFFAMGIVLFLIGLVAGFLVLWIILLLLPTPLTGLVTLVLSTTSSIGLYSFLFLWNIRQVVLAFALGIGFGILFHITLFPKTFRRIVGEDTLPNKKEPEKSEEG